MPYPICSVVAVFKMLVRILNTLRSRIWDMALFLFSDYSKSTVDENGNSPESYTPFRSAQNHCPPDNVRPAPAKVDSYFLFTPKTIQPPKQNFMLNCKKTMVKKKEWL